MNTRLPLDGTDSELMMPTFCSGDGTVSWKCIWCAGLRGKSGLLGADALHGELLEDDCRLVDRGGMLVGLFLLLVLLYLVESVEL